jgi:hypothetical protein
MPTSITSSGITFDDATTLTTGVLTAANIASGAVITAKVNDAAITPAKLSGAQSGSAPIYAPRAWAIFDGTGSITVKASGNISSITRLATGQYTVNLATAMPSAEYAALATLDSFTSTMAIATRIGTPTASSFVLHTVSNGTHFDTDNVSVLVIA